LDSKIGKSQNIYLQKKYQKFIKPTILLKATKFKTALNILDELMYYYDEPIADISIIPTYFACKLASQHNKIILSGEGADEFFAGYGWHKEYLWKFQRPELTKC
jgi:asparagine synthetase B (glutamine-hydrolysing)